MSAVNLRYIGELHARMKDAGHGNSVRGSLEVREAHSDMRSTLLDEDRIAEARQRRYEQHEKRLDGRLKDMEEAAKRQEVLLAEARKSKMGTCGAALYSITLSSFCAPTLWVNILGLVVTIVAVGVVRFATTNDGHRTFRLMGLAPQS